MNFTHLPYTVEYAKTSRTFCKTCNKRILLRTLRFGVMVESAPEWNHYNCYFPEKCNIPNVAEIANFEDLRWEDKERIKEQIALKFKNPGMTKSRRVVTSTAKLACTGFSFTSSAPDFSFSKTSPSVFVFGKTESQSIDPEKPLTFGSAAAENVVVTPQITRENFQKSLPMADTPSSIKTAIITSTVNEPELPQQQIIINKATIGSLTSMGGPSLQLKPQQIIDSPSIFQHQQQAAVQLPTSSRSLEAGTRVGKNQAI